MTTSTQAWSADEPLQDEQEDSSSSTSAVPDKSLSKSDSRTSVKEEAVSKPKEGKGIADFRRKTLNRVAAHFKAMKKKREVVPPPKYGHIDVEAHRRETQQLVNQRQLAAFQLAPGARPARVAIVGAGPVGMWIAVMLSREHAQLIDRRTAAPRIVRPPSAPTVDLFEQRRADACVSRRITLAMSSVTHELLNRHLVSDHGVTSNHGFAPACSINLVETVLRENFERYASAEFGQLHFSSEISDPETLFDRGYDVVIMAGGRQSLSDSWRLSRGLDLSETNVESALTLKFVSGSCSIRDKTFDEASLARVNSDLKIYIRPGASDDQGYAWVMGLPSDFCSMARTKLANHKPCTRFSELHDTLSLLLDLCSDSSPHVVEEMAGTSFDAAPSSLACPSQPSSPQVDSPPSSTSWMSTSLGKVLNMLDEFLQPVSVSPRVTTAAYWQSKDIVHESKGKDGEHRGWLVLAGDAACGRPFHMGSTLNGHFHDTVPLIRGPPWSQWDPAGQPFAKYKEEYRKRTAAVGFRQSKRL